MQINLTRIDDMRIVVVEAKVAADRRGCEDSIADRVYPLTDLRDLAEWAL